MSDVLNTLTEREKRYGKFMDNASTAQFIKEVMRDSPMWGELEWDQAEALDLIASKIGRMLSGDVNYIDNWHDIAGYATLVERRMNGDDVQDEGDIVDPRPAYPIGSAHWCQIQDYHIRLEEWEKRNPLARK